MSVALLNPGQQSLVDIRCRNLTVDGTLTSGGDFASQTLTGNLENLFSPAIGPYVITASKFGNLVVLSLPRITGTFSAGTNILFSTTIPVDLRPLGVSVSATFQAPCVLINNGSNELGRFEINNSNQILFRFTVAPSATSGINCQAITYTTA